VDAAHTLAAERWTIPPSALNIPSLDGLRAVSFGIVFLSHAGLERIIPGSFGVTIFFFLSGYLITTLMRLEAESTGRVSIRAFYLRRVLRILPPFYIVLAASVMLSLTGVLPGRLQGAAVAAQTFHFANYWIAYRGVDGIPPGTVVYWSLAVEEHFYLLFPALYIVMRRLELSARTQAFVFWSICALVLAWRFTLYSVRPDAHGFHASDLRIGFGTDTRIDSLLYGCALAVFANPAFEAPVTRRASQWMFAGLAASFALLVVTFSVRQGWLRETIRYSLQGIALYPIFIAAIRMPDSPLFRVLNLRPLRLIGQISYSLYLGHGVILNAIEHGTKLPRAAQVTVGFVASVVVSTVLWHAVEKPCARLRRRLHAAPASA
jgi:peptidoglycan/LPS O-acetylase OafA/YrhL